MKYVLGAILVSCLLFLASCSEGEQTTSVSGAFLGGTTGIEGNFEDFGVKENGVSTIFDTETFPIEVTLKNKGEYKIQAGDVKITLMGPSKEEFTGIATWELKNKDAIDQISELLPTGGEEMITFASDAKYTQTVNGILERQWFASIESKYQTYLIIPEVCLKEDLTDTRVCEVSGAKSFSVSGAPITISSVTEETAGQGIMALKIKVDNVGGGQVTKVGDAFGTQDRVAYTVDDGGWECKSGGKVGEARLMDNTAEILCKTKTALAEDTLSTKQLRLTFDYVYRNQINQKIGIKQSIS